MAYNNKLPNNNALGLNLIEQLFQNDDANLIVDYDTKLSGNYSRGTCVYFNSNNGQWSVLNGFNPTQNTIFGVMETDGASNIGQVRISGIYQGQDIQANKLYYADGNGNLTTNTTPTPIGRSTRAGVLVLQINGGSGSGSSSGGGGSAETTKKLLDYSFIQDKHPYRAFFRGIPSTTSSTTVRLFAFISDTTITAIASIVNMVFDEAVTFKVNDVITIDDEQLLITAIAGNAVTVTRGYNGTTPTAHSPESATSPIRAYSQPLIEVPVTPVAGEYQIIRGEFQFGFNDRGKFVEAQYDSVGYVGCLGDPLRNYGREPSVVIYAVLSGTVNTPSNIESQVFYVRNGVTVRPAYPGLLVHATGAVVMSGTVSANALIPANTWGNGGGAGGHNSNQEIASYSGFYGAIKIVSNGETPDIDKQNALLKAHGAYPLICGASGTAGSLAAGAGGGGVTFISPYIYFSGSILANANGGTSGSLNSSWGSAGGGGGGGAIIFIGERITNTGTFDVAGGAGASFRKTQGSDAGTRYSQAGGAGWVRLIEFGG